MNQISSISTSSLLRQYYYNAYDVTEHILGTVTEETYNDDK